MSWKWCRTVAATSACGCCGSVPPAGRTYSPADNSGRAGTRVGAFGDGLAGAQVGELVGVQATSRGNLDG
jgi:hypothetical protein